MSTKHEIVTVVLESEELAWAQDRAEREGKSLSSVFSALIRQERDADRETARRHDSWMRVREWALEGLDPEDREAARRELDAPSR